VSGARSGPRPLSVGSLFSGIGGLDLGFERAGFDLAWMCESSPYCRRVLARHWPRVPLYDDVCTLGTPDGPTPAPVDVLVGGFPCQDISWAGKGAGIDGARSGLWGEYLRLVRALRPGFVLVENVPALLARGLDRVLGDLAACGYDAEWEVLGADALGATQHRERVWILAYPDDAGLQGTIWAGQPVTAWEAGEAAHSEPLRSDCGLWPPGPGAVLHVPRMADGPAHRMDRLHALGNAVVPQVAEHIARALRAYAEARGLWPAGVPT